MIIGADRDDERRRDDRRDRGDRGDREPLPKKGNTVYVYGHNVTEEILRKAFSNFGTIVNISMETERQYVLVQTGHLLFVQTVCRVCINSAPISFTTFFPQLGSSIIHRNKKYFRIIYQFVEQLLLLS